MRLWKITDNKGTKTEVVKAWSMRHARFLKTLPGLCTYLLIGRSNPDNPDGWKARSQMLTSKH